MSRPLGHVREYLSTVYGLRLRKSMGANGRNQFSTKTFRKPLPAPSYQGQNMARKKIHRGEIHWRIPVKIRRDRDSPSEDRR